MKLIPLREDGEFKTSVVLTEICGRSATAISPGEMRQRIRIMDKIDAAIEQKQDHIALEDATHVVLVAAVNAWPWGLAKRELLRIIDDVCEAKASA